MCEGNLKGAIIMDDYKPQKVDHSKKIEELSEKAKRARAYKYKRDCLLGTFDTFFNEKYKRFKTYLDNDERECDSFTEHLVNTITENDLKSFDFLPASKGIRENAFMRSWYIRYHLQKDLDNFANNDIRAGYKIWLENKEEEKLAYQGIYPKHEG